MTDRQPDFYGDLNRAFAEIGKAFQPVVESLGRAFHQIVNAPGMPELLEWANSPEGKAWIAAMERGEIERSKPCHCLCGFYDHLGICEGDAVGTLPFDSPPGVRVDVAMCRPCMESAIAHFAGGRRG
uniref:hypothetical protein n=1 Tax=Herbidospora sakaeratensis TaxID=564415 RepID=UPI000785441E|nr:hypothetical protein [Herbidospora sakaeratensis]